MDRDRVIAAAIIMARNLEIGEPELAELLMAEGFAVDEAYRLIAFLPSAFSRPILEELGVSDFLETASVPTDDGSHFEVWLADQPEYAAALSLARDHRRSGILPHDVFVAIVNSTAEIDAVSNALNDGADIKRAPVALALVDPEHRKHVRRTDRHGPASAGTQSGGRGSTALTIFYRTGSARYQAVLVAIAALLSAGLTIAAFWALLDPGSMAWTVALVLVAPLSWWMVARFWRAARVRKAAIAAGRPALLADPAGLTFLDWQGESRQLGWHAIRGFRIVEIADEGPYLYVDGSYPHAGIQPIRFALADLDADGVHLVDTLERLRVGAGEAAA